MSLHFNAMAAFAQRMYTLNSANYANSIKRLSTGYRINSAADDPAGLAISEKMRAQIRGLQQASRNSQDAISMVQTAEGALQEVHSMLQRMNELANQAATGTLSDFDRQQVAAEFNQLKLEIDQTAKTTTFNGLQLLDGSLGANKVDVGAASTLKANAALGSAFVVTEHRSLNNRVGTYEIATEGDNIKVRFTDANTGDVVNTVIKASDSINGDIGSGKAFTLNLSQAGLGQFTITGVSNSATKAELLSSLNGTSLMTKAKPNYDTIGEVTVHANMSGVSVNGVAGGGTVDFSVSGQTVTMRLNGIAVGTSTQIRGDDGSFFEFDSKKAIRNANKEFRVEFTDDAGKVHALAFKTGAKGATMDDLQAVLSGAYASVSQTGGVYGAGEVKGIAQPTGTSASGTGGVWIQVGAKEGEQLLISIDAMNTMALGIANASISDQDAAGKAITLMKDAINIVSGQRAQLGAMQNRLEYKIRNLDNMSENLSAAESRIRDVDYARESMNAAKQNLLMQVSLAMMAQANAQAQNVLSLLRM